MINKKNVLSAVSLGVGLASIYFLHKKYASGKSNNLLKKIPSNKNLTQEMASTRRKIIKGDVDYQLYLHLKKGKRYSGNIEINFEINEKENLIIDFEGKILKFSVNDQSFSPKIHNKTFVEIPHKYLSQKNTIKIEFENKYRNDGNGIHSFIDTDGKQYLYTQGEPFHIHEMFPCFDQPNIKGRLALKVLAPMEWTVLGNEDVEDSNEEGIEVLYNFKKTEILSPYLYALVAGHFECVECEDSYRNIPIRLYCRKSLYPHLLKISDIWFDVTNKCLEFFERIFGIPYPFSKYDSVFCPEFNFSAMENPGCVTFSDTFHIPKERVPLDKISRSCVTIAHEMSHMWFGNLVTMQWWDDLWLNESFADFIGFYALQNLSFTSEKSNFERLFNARKQWGYREDQQKTTHPIASVVRDTEEADSIFDGITYSKGAAVLRQLLSLMGEENFSKSLKAYFTKYAWSNTTLQDFMECLKENFQTVISLEEWQDQWILKAGLNCISPQFDLNQKLLIIEQFPVLNEFPTLRFHKIQVAFFNENLEIYSKDVFVQANNTTEIDCSDLPFKPCAIMLNYKDESFVKVRFDEMSLNFFKTNLWRIKDELTQTMLWRFLYDMVRDAKLSARTFIELVIGNIDSEKELNFSIINDALTNAELAISAWTPLVYREDLSAQMFELTKELLMRTPASNDNEILVLKSKLIGFARTTHHVNKIYEWYMGKNEEMSQFVLKIKDAWAVVKKVVRSKLFSKTVKDQLLNDMLNKDVSDEGLLNSKEYSLLYADSDERKKAYEELLNPNTKESLYTLQSIMSGLNDSHFLTQSMVLQYFKVVKEVFLTRSLEFSKNFADFMFPDFKDLDFVLQKGYETLETIEPSQIFLIRILKENLESIERRKLAFKQFEEN